MPTSDHHPRIAVLVTYHNEASLLTECLESLGQSGEYPDEVLIYDDASTVPPEPYIPPGLPVRVIRGRQNRGPAYGRNALLGASCCEYVHFHDADDLFAPTWLREVRVRMDEGRIDALFTEVASYRDGKLVQEHVLGLESLERDPDLVRFCIRGALLSSSGTYRRDAVLAIGGYSTQYWQSEDYEFHIRLAARSLRFGVILNPLIRQRLHDKNRSGDQRRVWVDAVRILEALSAELKPEYMPDVCDALAKAGGILFRMGALPEARHAFAVARRVGRPRFAGQPAAYRLLARSCSPMFAERVGQTYRSLLPNDLRKALRADPEDHAD